MRLLDIFIRFYSCLDQKDRFGFYACARFVIRSFCNYVIPLYFVISSPFVGHRRSLPCNDIIVSLTSFPDRINRLWIVIECLLRQRRPPAAVYLWLSSRQFHNKNLPKKLLRQQKRGLNIEFVDGDLRSHKKYYYSFQQFPDKRVVLIDDDIFYPSTLVSELDEGWKRYDNPKIVCSYGYEMLFDETGSVLPYGDWRPLSEKEGIKNIFFGSGGGTMIQPSMLYRDVCNESLFFELCPLADDVWLNGMAQINNVRVIKVRKCGVILPVINNNSTNLSDDNLTGGNDTQIESMRAYYDKMGIAIYRNT